MKGRTPLSMNCTSNRNTLVCCHFDQFEWTKVLLGVSSSLPFFSFVLLLLFPCWTFVKCIYSASYIRWTRKENHIHSEKLEQQNKKQKHTSGKTSMNKKRKNTSTLKKLEQQNKNTHQANPQRKQNLATPKNQSGQSKTRSQKEQNVHRSLHYMWWNHVWFDSLWHML